ncbi:MAG: diacylglycerol kinase family protein, partial [Candidatus Aminicenantaceae bacterium]
GLSLLWSGCAEQQAADYRTLKYAKLGDIEVPEVEQVTLANGMRLFPQATPFDGRLHCFTLRTRSLVHSLRLSRRILDGSHIDRDEVDIFTDTAFRVTPARGPIAIQYDGEVMTGIEGFRASVRPAAVRVVTASGD